MISKTETIKSAVALCASVVFCLAMVSGLESITPSESYVYGAVTFTEKADIMKLEREMAAVMPASGDMDVTAIYYPAAK